MQYGILLTLKESYLFCRNLFGLWEHPFKTFRTMLREQDRSQMLLILGIPSYLLIGGLGLIWVGRCLIDAPKGQWGIFTKSGILMAAMMALLTFIYIAFWLWQVWQKRTPHEEK